MLVLRHKTNFKNNSKTNPLLHLEPYPELEPGAEDDRKHTDSATLLVMHYICLPGIPDLSRHVFPGDHGRIANLFFPFSYKNRVDFFMHLLYCTVLYTVQSTVNNTGVNKFLVNAL